MKKSLIAMAVGAALTAPLAAQAASMVDVSGFADVIYTYTNEGFDNAGTKANGSGQKNTVEKKFTSDGEIDFVASPTDGVTARIDLDISTSGSTTQLEQAFFAWNVTEPVTLVGGIFNNPIGAEEEDRPNINFTSHNSIFNILDNQTALSGNNVAGLALSGGNSMVTGTVAFLNDLQQVNEQNSIAVVLNAMPMPGVELEAGYVTQDKDGDKFNAAGVGETALGAGDVWDLNGSWSNIAGSGVTAGGEYFSTNSIIDGAYNLWAGIDLPQGFGLKLRYEATNSDIKLVDDSTAWTLSGSWQAASNLLIALEYTTVSADSKYDVTKSLGSQTTAQGNESQLFDQITGLTDGDIITLEFVATLGDFK